MPPTPHPHHGSAIGVGSAFCGEGCVCRMGAACARLGRGMAPFPGMPVTEVLPVRALWPQQSPCWLSRHHLQGPQQPPAHPSSLLFSLPPFQKLTFWAHLFTLQAICPATPSGPVDSPVPSGCRGLVTGPVP